MQVNALKNGDLDQCQSRLREAAISLSFHSVRSYEVLGHENRSTSNVASPQPIQRFIGFV
jgi:hypothetical protein